MSITNNKNKQNSEAIRWLAKTCHCLTEGKWFPEQPVIYNGSDFGEDSQQEANRALFDAVRRNGNVERISLKNLELSSTEGQLLADLFTSNAFLHTLTLSSVSFAGCDPRILIDAFANAKNVRTFALERCTVDATFSQALEPMFRSGSLKCLRFNKLDLSDASDELFSSISESAVSCLQIRNMRADLPCFERILKGQKKNSALESLAITRCGLGSEGAEPLADLLAANRHLETLNISENDFGGESVEILARLGLQRNESLRKLILSHNPIGDTGARVLAQWLCDNKSLQSLSLLDCEIWSSGFVALGRALKDMRGLKYLSVDSGLEDHVDIVLESMQTNMSLTRLSTDRVLIHDDDPKWQQVEFYLKLNRAKRRMLVEPNVPASLWPRILTECDSDANILFYMLQHKPELAAM